MVNFAPTNMTSNTTPAQFLAAASSNSSDAYKVFDSNDSTSWEPTTNNANEWIRIVLPFNTLIDSYTIKCPDVATRAPTNFKLQGSYDNGTNWVDLNTQTGLTSGWTNNVSRRFTFTPVHTTAHTTGSNGQSNINIHNYYVYRLLFTSQPSAKVLISEFTLEHIDPGGFKQYDAGTLISGLALRHSSSYGKVDYFDYKEVSKATSITIPVGTGSGGTSRPVTGQIFPRGVPI